MAEKTDQHRPSFLDNWAARWLAFSELRENQVFLVLTLLIGALTGLVVVAFILLTENFGTRLYPMGSLPWRRLFVPIGGSLAMGYLLYRYFPDARGSGVPQTKAALYAREGKITLGTVFGKFFCTAATLASGIPLGREGPAVQVGGGIASVLGRKLGLRTERVKQLIPVGAAAAIAAAFNTPLAAVLFALEEVVGDLQAPVLGSVVLASATSWGVLRLLLGNDPLFQVPQYQLVNYWEFLVYGLLGIAGGVVSVAFTQLLLRTRKWFLTLPQKTVWFQPVAGGVLVGAMGWFVPQVMGVGYGYVGNALNDHLALKLMVLLLAMKLVASAIAYGSGNAGGIFGPSLFLGAMLGGAIGGVAHQLFPAHVATPGAYALVGMGAAFAGIVRAPMTSVVMIFEITRDYAVIVPLMISNLVSYFIASRLQKTPIYEVLAEQDGIHLPQRGLDSKRRVVLQVMRPAGECLKSDEDVQETVSRIGKETQRTWPVCNRTGVIGVVTLEQLQAALLAPTLPDQGSASSRSDQPAKKKISDLLDGYDFPHLHTDHSLDLALDRLGATHTDLLPVVSRANIHQLLGVVHLHDVLKSYGVDHVTES
jgi:CIC family chloride channel protein